MKKKLQQENDKAMDVAEVYLEMCKDIDEVTEDDKIDIIKKCGDGSKIRGFNKLILDMLKYKRGEALDYECEDGYVYNDEE